MFQRRIVVIDDGPCGHRIATGLNVIRIDAVAAMEDEPAFDWASQATWPRAICGATALCIANAAPATNIGALAFMAADMGVEHIALCSVQGSRGVAAAEKTVRSAPLDHTFIRIARNAHPDEIAGAAITALCDPAHLNRTCSVPAHRSRHRHSSHPASGSIRHPLS